MIEMWDQMFAAADPGIGEALSRGDGFEAFHLMHEYLRPVWDEVYRLLKPGGLVCLNLGDATRTVSGDFVLYPNHAEILSYLVKIGFSPQPMILWRKQTNAPNKFMGSGMLPAGAYVTLEHEVILVVRKGPKREFTDKVQKKRRRESAFFWEERNAWFSDVWYDLKGTNQDLRNGARLRSGAFPFELAYRLINMFSVQRDLVLDPFLGLGTTLLAAMAARRNSVGFEVDAGLKDEIERRIRVIVPFANDYIRRRLDGHRRFVEDRFKSHGPFKYRNEHYGFPVMTKQETELKLPRLVDGNLLCENKYSITYAAEPAHDMSQLWQEFFEKNAGGKPSRKPGRRGEEPRDAQLR